MMVMPGIAERLLEYVLELVNAVDADSFGAKSSGVLRDVVVAQPNTRCAPVLQDFLEGDHVVRVVAHDDVFEFSPSRDAVSNSWALNKNPPSPDTDTT
jgi:hypothetical protein